MAGRPLNRRDLRRQAEVVEQVERQQAAPPEAPAAEAPQKKSRKPPATRKPRAVKAPPRMRARWCVFDGAGKPVALFAYNQRAAADAKLAEVRARVKGIHFIRLFKDAFPDPPDETK
jgi:hypothetical protein